MCTYTPNTLTHCALHPHPPMYEDTNNHHLSVHNCAREVRHSFPLLNTPTCYAQHKFSEVRSASGTPGSSSIIQPIAIVVCITTHCAFF